MAEESVEHSIDHSSLDSLPSISIHVPWTFLTCRWRGFSGCSEKISHLKQCFSLIGIFNCLKKLKKGYLLRCIYVLTSDYKINIARVSMRESMGSHGVPKKIKSRYYNALIWFLNWLKSVILSIFMTILLYYSGILKKVLYHLLFRIMIINNIKISATINQRMDSLP